MSAANTRPHTAVASLHRSPINLVRVQYFSDSTLCMYIFCDVSLTGALFLCAKCKSIKNNKILPFSQFTNSHPHIPAPSHLPRALAPAALRILPPSWRMKSPINNRRRRRRLVCRFPRQRVQSAWSCSFRLSSRFKRLIGWERTSQPAGRRACCAKSPR